MVLENPQSAKRHPLTGFTLNFDIYPGFAIVGVFHRPAALFILFA
jgi:hypothetical protein